MTSTINVTKTPGLALNLPSPRKQTSIHPTIKRKEQDGEGTKESASSKQRCPTYENRCQLAADAARSSQSRKIKLFVPRCIEDFDDGGAFPEIHVAQYPRHMGNPHLKRSSAGGSQGAIVRSNTVMNVEIDKDDKIRYDAIVKGGSNSNKLVYSRIQDVKGGAANEDDIALPTQEEEKAAKDNTAAALQAILQSKTAMDKPSGSAIVHSETSKNQELKTQFIKYTARPDAPGYNPAAAQRVIQMVPAQIDPMMPPKHKHTKAPRAPAEELVPVLHAPPTKLTKEEREAWNVPACISNWKNTRGYTIPLDKRLAADGRGLREHTINPNFAILSESLYVAEKQARQEVRMRAQVQKKLAIQEKERQEDELRELASKARLERRGVVVEEKESSSAAAAAVPIPDDDDTSDNDRAVHQRDRLRLERKKERERELRMENNIEAKRQKMEAERDVSEKIALGVHTGTGGLQGDVDSRLYSQSAGMDSGFGRDDEYNTYSKPLFNRDGVVSSSIYRPTRGDTSFNADEQVARLRSGESSGGPRAGSRTEPVQFELEKK